MPRRRQPRRETDAEVDVKNPTGNQLEQGLEFVTQRLEELPSLKDKEPFGDEYTRWARVTSSGLARYFGKDSEEYAWVYPRTLPKAMIHGAYESETNWQARLQREQAKDYAERLTVQSTGLQSILDKHALLPESAPAPRLLSERAAKAFISHGGLKPSLTMIEDLLRALGVEPVVVEKRASEAREVHENVDVHKKQCHFAIVLWTKDTQDVQGAWWPSGSIAEEAGALRTEFPRRVIYLKEDGVSLPAMASTIQYQTFTEDNIGPAYFKIVTELKEWGFLRVASPGGASAP